jgi:hypothetical protein
MDGWRDVVERAANASCRVDGGQFIIMQREIPYTALVPLAGLIYT